MNKIKNLLGNFEKNVCNVLLVTILIILTYQVILRYIFKFSQPWPEELARYLFIWLIFLGASYAAQEYAHIRIEALLNIYPKKLQKYILLLGNIFWIAFCFIMFYVSGKYTLNIYNSQQISIGVKINMAYAYAAIPIGYLLLNIRIISRMFIKKEINKGGDI